MKTRQVLDAAGAAHTEYTRQILLRAQPVIAKRGRILFLVILWLALSIFAHAQSRFNEREVKAVFLFNFVQFVDWPMEAFAGPQAPVVIGVLGDDPFGRV